MNKPSASAFQRYLAGETPSVPSNDVLRPTQALTLQDHARRIVFNYITPRLEKTDTHVTFEEDEVYVVWFSYILGNWKALISTTLPDGMYYEVTHNQAKSETYLDAYKKFDNVCIPDSALDYI